MIRPGSLVGATFAWTEHVYSFPCMSFVSLAPDASIALIIESREIGVARSVGQVVTFDWSADDWVTHGWEIFYP